MSRVSLLCVECVRLIGTERAEWAAVYRGRDGYCPDHLSPDDQVVESMRALEASENPAQTGALIAAEIDRLQRAQIDGSASRTDDA